MKTPSSRVIALAAITLVTLAAGAGTASAIDLNVAIGQPPPPVVETYGPPPQPGAVWIRGHQQWTGGGWRWIPGHWGYPPHRGWVWVPGHYNHQGYWREGHWRRNY